MHVCFISHSASRGGAELSLLDLIDALRARGIRCSCFLPREGALDGLLARKGVEATVVPYKQWVGSDRSVLRRARRLGRTGQALRPLVSAIRRTRCDVVYTNTVTTCAGAVAAKIAGKPHVWHIREFGFDDHGLNFDFGVGFSRRLVGWLSAACVANSRAVAEEYAPYLGGTVPEVVYNSVEIASAGDGEPPETPWRHQGAIRCMVVGRLQPRKGQEEAIRGMVELGRANVPAELLLLGNADPEYRARLERVIDEHGLTDRVHVLPFSDSPAPLMHTADVILVCSRREAFGRVAVEAMKLRKPVIGTRSGGMPEVVQDGTTGFLYTPGDTRELAARIAELWANPGTREAMGVEGRRRARSCFTREKYGRDVERILKRVIDRGGQP
jgi:glycosyltransferase involved in cell wall biosynthesis